MNYDHIRSPLYEVERGGGEFITTIMQAGGSYDVYKDLLQKEGKLFLITLSMELFLG